MTDTSKSAVDRVTDGLRPMNGCNEMDAGAEMISALAKERDELQAEVERLREALIWCSGSDDFQESGKARAGWLKLCAPLLKALQRKEGDE